MKPTLRKRWLQIHRWIGLSVGLLLSLIGLTGSVLVFDHAIDEWLNPDLLVSQNAGDRASVQSIIRAAEASYGEEALSLSRPRIDNGVWTVWFQSGTEDAPTFTQVLVDPYSAEVTGQRVWGQYLMSWIYRLHFRLLAGQTGAVIVGMVGIVTLVSIASGLYLWWPLLKHSWRSAFAMRKGKRAFDLHKTGGVLASVVLLVVAFTGTYMEFPDWFRVPLSVFSEVSDPADDFTSVLDFPRTPLDADRAIEIAQESFPDATFDHLHPPVGEDGFYEVAFRQPGEVQQSFGRSQVFLDQYTGEILMIRSPEDFTAADAFIAWQFPLHNGEVLGLFGRWCIFIAGFSPALLSVTGTLVWWRRQKKLRQSDRSVARVDAEPANSMPVPF